MSILLIGDPGSLGEVLVRRLVSQGDEVRAIATDPGANDLAAHGVHIARGRDLDADLVERAAQNVRTIVTFDASVLEPVIDGATAANVDRIVVCAAVVAEGEREQLRTSKLEYVVLVPPRKGLLRRGIPDDALAEAIDAADDTSGRLRLELDLNESAAWAALGLDPPAPSGA
ncbi:MAG: hypothetical protein KY391_06200 [Actinobacteria bacterium]|nr:hypothetical protein [Actinomycetota bacterium]